MNASNLLTDTHGRTVRYVRLSVTDRCNLRCTYCRSNIHEKFIPHANVLRYEELLRLVRVAVGLGVQKVRLTGGEPFARKGLLSFMESLHTAHPHVDIRLTTNATLVREHVPALRDIGVRTVNISLDSFNKETFARVTGRDLLHEVRATIDALLTHNIFVKINAVAMRGVNDGELRTFVDFARTHPVDVRFIEFMPMGSDTQWNNDIFWSAEDIVREAGQSAKLVPCVRNSQSDSAPNILDTPETSDIYDGPARMFRIEGGQGRLGIITPLTNHFCHACNRLRITSDGFLRTCLFADKECALRNILRHPKLTEEKGDDIIRHIFVTANRNKPLGTALLKARQAVAVAKKNMVSIGG